jgi:hypothetical protein
VFAVAVAVANINIAVFAEIILLLADKRFSSVMRYGDMRRGKSLYFKET